jgi:hypothetical protein
MDLQFLPTPGAYIPRTGSTYEKDFAIGSALFFLRREVLVWETTTLQWSGVQKTQLGLSLASATKPVKGEWSVAAIGMQLGFGQGE